MVLEFISVAGVLLITAVVLLSARLFLEYKRQPPGPFGIPILGYLPFVGKNPAEKYFELSKSYGPIMSVKLGPQSFVVLNDYESVTEAFVRKGQFLSGRPQNPTTNAFSNNGFGIVFHDYNEDIKIQRRFFLKTLRGFGIEKASLEEKILDEIEYFLAELDSGKTEPIRCRELLALATANVINTVILGSRRSYQDEELQLMIEVMNRTLISDEVNALRVNLLLVAPALRFVPPFSEVLNNIREGRKFIRDTLRKVAEAHRHNLDPEHLRDFVDEFLVKIDSDKPDDSSFSETQLYESIIDLFLGGAETTSTIVAYAFLALALYPNIQSKLYDEIVRVIGERKPSMKNRNEMAYLSAFIHELSRHRTLFPLSLPHCATEKIDLMGYVIPKGETIIANLWAIHHDPKNFENPDEFRPERFIDDEGKFVNDRRVIPFSVGPRYCPGEHLAKVEVFLFIASVLQRFKVQAHESAPLPTLLDDGVVGTVITPKEFKVSFVPR